tara:strand:- start:208 stop:795 length:588 start_codon:yes stop_codon:yes gene_type:complete
MTQYTRNILKVFNQVSLEEYEHGKDWYSNALNECQAMADKYELPLHIVVGVVAALSPTNRWERNLVDADNMLACYVEGGYVEDTAPCTYKKMRDKAWDILQTNPHSIEDTAFILRGPKITDFFLCIMGQDVCVIDGHAWCIANADRRTMQEVPSIGKKLRKDLQTAYSRAGKKHGMTAYQMQAATWVAWKRMHNV